MFEMAEVFFGGGGRKVEMARGFGVFESADWKERRGCARGMKT